MEVIKKCRDCQLLQKQMIKHVNHLRPIDISWSFAVWGIDIVDILTRAPGDFRYLFFGIDTFTKWIEVMPTVNITQEAAVKFLHSIIYRFGVPRRVLIDNRTQFKGAILSNVVRISASNISHHLQRIPRRTDKSSELMD
jgi:hypothetical protein